VFAGDAHQPGKRERRTAPALETVIGYSDSADYTVNAKVGPVAVKDPAEGRFAGAVKIVVRDSLTKVSPSGAAEDTRQQQTATLGKGANTSQQDARSGEQSDFKAFLQSRTRKSVYDELPPPERQ
jgi:hypothetical protein